MPLVGGRIGAENRCDVVDADIGDGRIIDQIVNQSARPCQTGKPFFFFKTPGTEPVWITLPVKNLVTSKNLLVSWTLPGYTKESADFADWYVIKSKFTFMAMNVFFFFFAISSISAPAALFILNFSWIGLAGFFQLSRTRCCQRSVLKKTPHLCRDKSSFFCTSTLLSELFLESWQIPARSYLDEWCPVRCGWRHFCMSPNFRFKFFSVCAVKLSVFIIIWNKMIRGVFFGLPFPFCYFCP